MNDVGEEEDEFEYDAQDTESFYIELDLSTVKGGAREPLQKTRTNGQSGNGEENPSDIGHFQQRSTTSNDGNVPSTFWTTNTNHEDASNSASMASNVSVQSSSVQILDLHDPSPLVSYRNQIYSCSWSDTIGTAMFFAKAQAGLESSIPLSTDDFHLVGISRMKIVGQKAKLSRKAGTGRKPSSLQSENQPRATSPELNEEDSSLLNGKSWGGLRTTNPTTNAGIKRQAAFLEELMEIKRSKGEPDNVRTVFTSRNRDTKEDGITGDPGTASRGREFSSVAQEIEYLNKLVVLGDAAALVRLQEIYSSMEGDALNPTP